MSTMFFLYLRKNRGCALLIGYLKPRERHWAKWGTKQQPLDMSQSSGLDLDNPGTSNYFIFATKLNYQYCSSGC